MVNELTASMVDKAGYYQVFSNMKKPGLADILVQVKSDKETKMEWMITSFRTFIRGSIYAFVCFFKEKRIQLPMFYIIFPHCLPF